jgi:Resolvase, N terminal domain
MSATAIASKVTAAHLARTAYLYVRQSTLRQVHTNTESGQRQYALRQRAIQLGWPVEQIVVIDSDQGQSGASAADREGFQRLVADVGLGKAGIVLGLEVSRLARNNADWHRLLEISALAGTLICDEDGLYDPADFNDRLLLGLKGHDERGGAALHPRPIAGRDSVQSPPRRATDAAPGRARRGPRREGRARSRPRRAGRAASRVHHVRADRVRARDRVRVPP